MQGLWENSVLGGWAHCWQQSVSQGLFQMPSLQRNSQGLIFITTLLFFCSFVLDLIRFGFDLCSGEGFALFWSILDGIVEVSVSDGISFFLLGSWWFDSCFFLILMLFGDWFNVFCKNNMLCIDDGFIWMRLVVCDVYWNLFCFIWIGCGGWQNWLFLISSWLLEFFCFLLKDHTFWGCASSWK